MRYVFANFTTGLNQYDRTKFFNLCAKKPVTSVLVTIVHPNEIQKAIDERMPTNTGYVVGPVSQPVKKTNGSNP